MEVSNLSTLSRCINILLLYTDCRGGRTAAIARHVSFAQITCCNQSQNAWFCACAFIAIPKSCFFSTKTVMLKMLEQKFDCW